MVSRTLSGVLVQAREYSFRRSDVVEVNGGNGKEKTRTYTLPLENDRSFKVNGPETISKSELERIKNWLSFQFIVEDEK